jgi:hypothetical protein
MVKSAIALVWLLALLTQACANPVHDDDVAALGPEDPNVPRGPLHRPGQPCLTCHGGQGPAGAQFSLGGTIYEFRLSTAVPAVGALVQVEDIDGNYWTVPTNEVGNFFVGVHEFVPVYPIKLNVFSADLTITQNMQTYSARQGSCAACHAPLPTGPTSPGPVYLQTTSPDGGTP